MEQIEQVFFNVPLFKLEPIFKRWIKEAQAEMQPTRVEPTDQPEQWLDLNDLVKYDPEKRTKPTWYSKISRNEVPHYKRHKKIYFLKSEIDDWLKEGKCKSNSEIEQEAKAYLLNNKKGLK